MPARIVSNMIPLVNGQVRACAQFGVCLVSITGRHQADSADRKRIYGTVPNPCR